MKNHRACIISSIVLIATCSSLVYGEQVYLTPDRISSITLDGGPLNNVVAATFKFPKKVFTDKVELNYAVLEFSARLRSGDWVRFSVVPVDERIWDSAISKCNGEWAFTPQLVAEYRGTSVTLKGLSAEELRSDITFVVQAIIDGYVAPDARLVIAPTRDCMKRLPGEYIIDEKSLRLKIRFTME